MIQWRGWTAPTATSASPIANAELPYASPISTTVVARSAISRSRTTSQSCAGRLTRPKSSSARTRDGPSSTSFRRTSPIRVTSTESVATTSTSPPCQRCQPVSKGAEIQVLFFVGAAGLLGGYRQLKEQRGNRCQCERPGGQPLAGDQIRQRGAEAFSTDLYVHRFRYVAAVRGNVEQSLAVITHGLVFDAADRLTTARVDQSYGLQTPALRVHHQLCAQRIKGYRGIESLRRAVDDRLPGVGRQRLIVLVGGECVLAHDDDLAAVRLESLDRRQCRGLHVGGTRQHEHVVLPQPAGRGLALGDEPGLLSVIQQRFVDTVGRVDVPTAGRIHVRRGRIEDTDLRRGILEC